jgi:hypothetical protein
MAYTNKKSAKRKHRKYRRRTKKGGVVRLVANPNNSQAISRKKSPIKEPDEAAVFQGVANDYTRAALDNAVAIFSRKAQEQEQALAQAQAQAPQLTVTVHGKSRAKRPGPSPGQIKKEQEKEEKALAKQLKETEKALAKQQKEAEKAAKKAAKEEIKAAEEVTRAGVDQAFSSMFGEKYKASGPKLRKRK